MKAKTKRIIVFISAIVICQIAGLLGSLFTTPSLSIWYAALQKPSFQPPSWLFAPVWTALFVLIGIALYLVWSKKTKKPKKTAIKWFSIQLGLNVLWSALFFGMHSPLLALIELILLWIAILLTIISFYKISKQAAYCLIPYILWVSFAAVLNLAIVLLN